MTLADDQKAPQRPTVKQGTGSMGQQSESQPKGREVGGASCANEWMERKVRHNSRVEKLARMPKIKEGRLLDDVEGCWFLPAD